MLKRVFKRTFATNKYAYENHKPEDAIPFSIRNKYTLALKMITFTAIGLSIPPLVVRYHVNKK